MKKKWEETFFNRTRNIRKIALRSTIVFGNTGGVFEVLSKHADIGLGGHHLSGEQIVSWIHIDDLIQAIKFMINNKKTSGIYNLGSPNPIKEKKLMKTIRDKKGTKIYINIPEWMMNIGAIILQTEKELVKKSRWIYPQKLIEEGFKFKYPTLESAVNHLLK